MAKDIPFVALDSSDFGGVVGTTVKCHNPECGEQHEVRSNSSTSKNEAGETVVTENVLQTYQCGGKSFVAGMFGRSLLNRRRANPAPLAVPEQEKAQWTRNAALDYIAVRYAAVKEAGWTIWLGGGLLLKCGSDKLELVLRPDNASCSIDDVLNVFPDAEWFDREEVAEIYTYQSHERDVILVFQTAAMRGV